MNKILTLMIGATIAASFATAAAAEVTLEVYHAWGSHAKRFHEPIAEEFMKLHPDVKIKFRAPAANYNEGHLTIMREALTDQLPDVWYSGYNLLEELVTTLRAREQIVALSPFLEQESTEWIKENYDPHVLELGQVDGKQWGIPFNASTPIVYYNVDLVRQAGGDPDNLPTEWDGVIDLATRIDGLGGDIDGMSLSIANEHDWFWQAIVLGYGGHIMNADKTEVTLGDAAGQKSVALIRRFVAETNMPLQTEEQGIQQFVAGKMGMFFGSTAEVRIMDDSVGGKFDVKTGPFPLGHKETGRLPTGGNSAVILSKDPEKQKAAWEFIKFATSPAGQKIVVLGSGYMPTNIQTTKPEYLGEFYEQHPDWTTSLKQWPIATRWFGYPGAKGVKIWREQSAILNSVARGETETQEGEKQLVEVTQRLVDE
jgi:multiple sugar transport system substrate-binding protein